MLLLLHILILLGVKERSSFRLGFHSGFPQIVPHIGRAISNCSSIMQRTIHHLNKLCSNTKNIMACNLYQPDGISYDENNFMWDLSPGTYRGPAHSCWEGQRWAGWGRYSPTLQLHTPPLHLEGDMVVRDRDTEETIALEVS